MIEYLKNSYANNRLHNSWLIISNYENSLAELNQFIKITLFKDSIELKNNPDFKLVQCLAGTRNISVDQIRELQEFIHRTSAVFPYKVAIIYQAEFMNHNAANCCLKLLEEASPNNYIFLITNSAASILPTIRSRCAKLQHILPSTILGKSYIQFLSLITLPQRVNLIEKKFDKTLEWSCIADYFLQLVARLIKKSINIPVNLYPAENDIMQQLRFTSPIHLLKKYENMQELINNTVSYDLDLRTSIILLVEELNE